MKVIWIAVLLAAVVPSCAAQKIEGKWSCTSEDVKHTKLDWVLTIHEKALAYSVHMEGGRDNDVFDLEDVKFDGKQLTARITLNPPDDFVTFTLTPQGDRLDGHFDGKNSGTGPFLCHR